MSVDKRLLAATTAVLLTSSVAATAQVQGGAAGPPTVPSNAERAGLSLSTEAASLFARDRNISVSQRPHEGYEARGLRTGGFMVYPKVSVTAEGNDNIYATDTNEVDDLIWRVNPEISAASNWSRHALGAYARTILNRYQDSKDENTTDYGVGVNGRLDILRDTNATANVDWAKLTEPRTSPNSPGVAAEPVRYELSTAGLNLQHTVNRIRLGGKLGYQKFNYANPPQIGGGFVDQGQRDREVSLVGGRVDYAVSPATALFLEVTGNKRDYRREGGATELDRDSKGVQFLGGANFELGAITRGEVAVGYIKQDFQDARLDNVDGFGARAEVEWFPTELTTFTFTGARTVEDSAVPGSGAYLATNLSARVDHELLRNVILNGRVGYGRDKYDNIGRRDERKSASVGATYLLNRVVGVTAAYSYDEQKTKRGEGKPFTVNKLSATVTAQF